MAFGQAEEYWRLQGSLHIGDRNLSTGDLAATGLRHLGDVSELGFAPTQNYAEHREHQSGKGFKDLMIPVSTDCPLRIVLDNLAAKNLKDFFQSTQATISSGSVSSEAHTAPAVGQSFLLDNPVVSAFTSIVPAPSGTAYTAGTDYIRDGAQIYVPAGSAMAGDDVLCNYTKGAATDIDLFAAADKNYFFYFNGINTTNNKKLTLRLWKVRFRMGALSALISDQITTMSLDAEALHEPLKANASNLGGYGNYYYET